MTFLSRVCLKFYYCFWNSILPKKRLTLPVSFREKKNIFLYFDYEREFGGHEVKISDYDIKFILKLLKEYGFKSTWFTVGKIFDKYPDSIKGILKQGHEIGSHSFFHISPLQASSRILEKDFKLFNEKSQNILKVKGFHSPNGKWAFKMFKYFKKHDFYYDIVNCRRRKRCQLILMYIGFKKQILRIPIIGDDWSLYQSNFNEKQTLNYFQDHSRKIKKGEVGGIGFHPWVLFSDKNLLGGFTSFLKYLKKQEDIRIETAFYYANTIKPKLD